MELSLNRQTFTKVSTIGALSDSAGNVLCHILEDVDRGLHSDMTSAEISAIKVHGKTAIPRGRYNVAITMSNRFKRELPLLIGVPGFEGIRIHPGNSAADTEGCLLPGVTEAADFVGQSRVAFDKLNGMIHRALNRGEQVWITIE